MKLGFHIMDLRRDPMRFCICFLYFSIAATLFTQCADARRSRQVLKFEGPTRPRTIIKATKKLQLSKHLDFNAPLDPSYAQSDGVSSPFSLPPLESLAPIPLPENTPPFCVYSPFTPQPRSTATQTPRIYPQPPPSPYSFFTPILPIQSPPPSPPGTFPNPPEYSPTPNPPESAPSPPSNMPSPPEPVPCTPINVPSPPESVPSPPEYGPSPPSHIPSPPHYIPSPSGFVPSPPVFQPPVVFPPPSVPPSPHRSSGTPLWCVAKPSVPDPIIQEAMNYACGSGAECGSIQPDGSCYHPNTLFAHASYAFNSCWQRTKVAGGTCDFGGTAMLITVDPSFDGCHFLLY